MHSPIFGQIVAAFRADLAMTQDDLSARMGWPPGMLSRIEAGRSTAKITHIADVERVFIAEKRFEKAGDVFKLVGKVADELKRRGIEPEHRKGSFDSANMPEVHRVVQRVVDEWLTPLPGWPPSCPVCGVSEGRCIVMHAPGARSAPQPVSPRRFTTRPHAGRQGGRAYYPGGSP